MSTERGLKPVSPEDATLWCATTPQTQLQIGALCRFEGGPLRDADGQLRVDDLHDHVASRLHLLPGFRQRLRRVPFDMARPVWVDDDDFDLARHLRTATLPAPGGTGELRSFMADLLGRPLDPEHPAWDMWLLNGLDDGDVAVVLRADHVIADGLSLLESAVALLDLDDKVATDPAPVPWSAVPSPDSVALLTESVLARGRHQLEMAAGAARGLLLDPRRAVDMVRSTLGAITSPPAAAPPLPLTGRVGTRRDFLWTSLPLRPLQDLAHSRGATLNDVVLAVLTGALRRVLGPDTAETLAGKPPRVLVPMGDSAGGDSGNTFSFVVTDLPVDLDDHGRVLDHIHAGMQERKASHQSADALSLFSIIDVVPVPLLRRLIPEILARQPFVNFAATNLPGTPVPLYLLGSRLLELQPIVTGVGNIACIVGVLSYCDDLGVGLTVDPDVVPDADAFLAALRDVSSELTAASPQPDPAR